LAVGVFAAVACDDPTPTPTQSPQPTAITDDDPDFAFVRAMTIAGRITRAGQPVGGGELEAVVDGFGPRCGTAGVKDDGTYEMPVRRGDPSGKGSYTQCVPCTILQLYYRGGHAPPGGRLDQTGELIDSPGSKVTVDIELAE
jgi:hypothetical protein